MEWQIKLRDLIGHRLLKTMTHMLALVLLYGAVSASVLDRFMIVNGNLIHSRGLSFDRYLEQKLPAPFSYRVLVPLVVNAMEPVVTRHLSESQKTKLTTDPPLRQYMQVKQGEPMSLTVSVRYHLGYFISFASLIALGFVLRALSHAVDPNERNLAGLAPVAFILLLPLTFLQGGYLYDFPELLFLAISFWAIVTHRMAILCCVLPLAILNKESNVLIPIFCAAYFWKDIPISVLAKRVGVLIVVSLASYVLGRYLAPDTGGSMVFHNFARNMRFFSSSESWFLWFRPYGGLIPFPRGYNIFLLCFVFALILVAWRKISHGMKRVLLTVFVINAYLVVTHGYTDELRNWSLLFIPLYLAFIEYMTTRTVVKGSGD